jgi:hypothetical protein
LATIVLLVLFVMHVVEIGEEIVARRIQACQLWPLIYFLQSG